MSRPPSLLDKLDAIEAMADSKLAAREPVVLAEHRKEQPAAPPPSPAPPSQADIYELLAELKRDIVSLQREQQQSQPSQEQQLYGVLAELRRDIELLRREQVAQALPPTERQLYAMLNELRSDIRTLQESHDDGTGGRSQLPARRNTPQLAGPAGGRSPGLGSVPVAWVLALLPVAAVAGYLAMGWMQKNRPVVVAPPAATQQAAVVANLGPTALFEALSAGATSPRGAKSAGVNDLRALSKASQLLSDPARDTDEAAFWLKRYVSGTLGDAQVVRSLTQLGSSYADTTAKEADYVKARYLWEIASAAGDPVAMCFLGRLFEGGMSVPANRKVALAWYERAKASGGCADADDAIARLR